MHFNEALSDPQREFYYRVNGRDYTSEVSFHVETYEVTRHTPKGVVLDNWGEEKRVMHAWRKKFAYKTVSGAIEGFMHRKKRHVEILTAQLAGAEQVLAAAEKWTDEDKKSLEKQRCWVVRKPDEFEFLFGEE